MLAKHSLLTVAALLVCAVAGCAPAARGAATPASQASTPHEPSAVAPSAVALSAVDPSAVDHSTEDGFTEWIADLFQARSGRVKTTILAPLTLNLEIAGTDRKHLRMSLERMWHACQADNAGCDASVHDFVAKAVDTLTTPEAPITRDEILAVVRPRGYFDAVGGPSAPNVMADPLVDDLYVLYVVDLPQALRGVAPADLTALKLTRADLAPLARANLEARLGHVDDVLAAAPPGQVTVLARGNDLESSRLLLLDDWQKLAAKVGQSVAVAVPESSVMIVSIGSSPEQLAKVRDVVAGGYAKAQRPVSPRVFQWQGTQWAPIP